MQYKASQYNIVVQDSGPNIYLYNSVSGGFCTLEREIFDEIQLGYTEDKPYFHELLNQGYIVPEQQDEFNKLQVNQAAYIFGESDTMRIVIAPSMACNLRCIYCFEQGTQALQQGETMTQVTLEQTAKFICDQISANQKLKKVTINWFGGEPLLQIKKICWLSNVFIECCKERNIEYSGFIITNGLLLTKENCDILYRECKINRLQVTIDGEEEFYCYYKGAKPHTLSMLISNLEYASHLFNIDVRLNTSVENQTSISRISRCLMENTNITDRLRIYPAQITECQKDKCHSMTDQEYEDFRAAFEQEFRKCRKGNGSIGINVARRLAFCSSMRRNHFVVGPDGSLYKCEHELGNRNQITGDVWNGMYHNQAETQFYTTPLAEKCRKCSVYPFCLGGCPTARVIYKKTIDCNAFHQRIYVKLYKELLEKYK